jgi:hypothetical protein
MVIQINRASEGFLFEKYSYFRSQGRELCWELYSFSDTASIVPDHFLSGLWLRDRVLSLKFLLESEKSVRRQQAGSSDGKYELSERRDLAGPVLVVLVAAVSED